MILITGATGAVGSRVARLLVGRGKRLRLMARDMARDPARLASVPGTEDVAVWASRDDLAAVVAAVLMQEGHEGQTYDVTDPETLSLSKTAECLSLLVGRRLSYLPETREEALASRRHFGVPDCEVDAWVSSYEAIAAGELAPISDTVPRLTGSPA